MIIVVIGIFCLLAGIALVMLVLVRKLPALAQSDIPASSFKITLPKIPLHVDAKAIQRRSFTALEVALRGLRSTLFAFLRLSEHFLRLAQAKSGKRSVPVLSQFLFRTKRRKAYLEEERKLLDWIEHHQDDVVAHKRLGNLYSVAGNIGEARTAFQQALKLAPEDDEIKKRLDELASL